MEKRGNAVLLCHPESADISRSGDNTGDNFFRVAHTARIFRATSQRRGAATRCTSMHPKRELKDRNTRREEQRRGRFLRMRLGDAPRELKFAQAKIASLPDGKKRPPDWAIAAARLSWKTGFGRLEKLNPSSREKFGIGEMWELFGVFRRLVSYVNRPPETGGRKESLSPGQVFLGKYVAKSLARKFLKTISRFETNFQSGFQLPTEAELIEQTTRSQIGVEGHFGANGQPAGMKSKSARILFLLWIFWPVMEHRFNSPAIHLWLKTDCDETASDKLVEALVTALRRDAAAHP